MGNVAETMILKMISYVDDIPALGWKLLERPEEKKSHTDGGIIVTIFSGKILIGFSARLWEIKKKLNNCHVICIFLLNRLTQFHLKVYIL